MYESRAMDEGCAVGRGPCGGARGRALGTGHDKAKDVVRAARALRPSGSVCFRMYFQTPRGNRRGTPAPARHRRGTVCALLTYTGLEDFVPGDAHVRRLVANVIGKRAVSAPEAETLVRTAAYELILPPRRLDHEIRRYGVSGAEVAKPPLPPRGD